MIRTSIQAATMMRLRITLPILATLALTCFAPAALGQNTQRRGFWVAGAAEVTVRADEAIVVMGIRTSAPTVIDAYNQNETTTQQVAQTLDELGLNGKYRFSGDRFDSPGTLRTPTPPYFQLGGQQRTPAVVTKYVFVTFGEPEISNVSFEQKLASTVASLSEAGAAPAATVGPPTIMLQATPTVIFTVKDPDSALSEATSEAIQRARATGQQTAKQLGVRINGIIDARINRPLEIALPHQWGSEHYR